MSQANLSRFKTDLDKLLKLGAEMDLELTLRAADARGKLDDEQEKAKRNVDGAFGRNYQRWYTEASAVVQQVLPNRTAEFDELYRSDPRRKKVDHLTFSIQDWMTGTRAAEKDAVTKEKHFNDFGVVRNRFDVQMQILEAARTRFESSIFDIRQLVQADLFDSEIDVAKELYRNGFLRPAGVVAGIVLEKHLAQVCTNHTVAVQKQHPAISDLNDLLKNANVVDVPSWRQIQRLTDLRNLCAHNKQREPTDAEVEVLINGADKLAKTIF